VALDRAQADDPGYSMAILLREVISAGTSPRQARLPMTPEKVAASYAETDEELADREFGPGHESWEDLPADDEPGNPDGPAGEARNPATPTSGTLATATVLLLATTRSA
jgi:hypothetical protein